MLSQTLMAPEGQSLALASACLNAAATGLIVTGYVFILRRNTAAHRFCMVLALTASAFFLGTYLARHALYGDVKYQGQGLMRAIYFVILATHVPLAIAIVPMVLRTAFLGWKGRLAEHRRAARWALPLWLYVSVTGILVYAMVYH